MKMIEVAIQPASGDRLVGAGCTLEASAMPARLRQWAELRQRATGLRSTPDGLVLRLPDDEPLGALADLMAAESECCSFYIFTLRIDGPTRELAISAGTGRAITVEALLGLP